MYFDLITAFIDETKILPESDVRILNESITIFFELLNKKNAIIEDKILEDQIYKYINLINEFPESSMIKIIENERNYCFFKTLIFFNNRFFVKKLNNQIIFAFKKNIILKEPALNENLSTIFMPPLGKELLDSFGSGGNIIINPERAQEPKESKEPKEFFFDAKYLKYKRKYLQLKKYYNEKWFL